MIATMCCIVIFIALHVLERLTRDSMVGGANEAPMQEEPGTMVGGINMAPMQEV